MYKIPDWRRVGCVWYLKAGPYAEAEITREEGRGRQEPDDVGSCNLHMENACS